MNKEKEFNLSEKISYNENRMNKKPYAHILIKDVKEFIKRLKDIIRLKDVQNLAITTEEIIRGIDKLAGDKLNENKNIRI